MITTKWPRLIVVGDPVTPEQADEILIRTNDWHYFATNDRTWEPIIEAAAFTESGRPVKSYERLAGEERGAAVRAHYEADRAWRQQMGLLELHHLSNQRIASCWIGGAHGWCDWDGRIGCDSYNIGKWPVDHEITEDWEVIAAAFPFLTLTAQCVDEEGEGAVAAEWRVRDGSVDYVPAPGALIAQPPKWDETGLISGLLCGSERGVTEERLRSALRRVAAARR